MTPRTAAPETVALTGWLLPEPGDRVDPTEARDDLRALGLLGTVEAGPLDVDEPCLLVLLGTADQQVLTLRDGAVVPGRALAELGPELARLLGGRLEIEDHEFTAQPDRSLPLVGEADGSEGCCGGGCCGAEDSDEQPSDQRTDVIAFRGGSDVWPLLARTVGSPISAWALDGWSVVALEETYADLTEHVWFGPELPLVQLFASGADRFVEVRTDAALDAETHLLAPLPTVLATFDRSEVDDERIGWLGSPHLLPGSAARSVASARAFADVSLDALVEALSQPSDERWSAGVLRVLGLPSVVADLHERRTPVGSGTWVEPAGLLRAGFDMARFYEDAPDEEVLRRGPFGRFYGLTRKRPDIALGWLLTKTVASAALLRAGRRRDSRGLRALGWSGVAEVALDAALVARQAWRRR